MTYNNENPESNNGLYFIVGGIVVVVAILAVLFLTGRIGHSTEPQNVTIETPAAPAPTVNVEPAAPAAPAESTPAPADAAPAEPAPQQ